MVKSSATNGSKLSIKAEPSSPTDVSIEQQEEDNKSPTSSSSSQNGMSTVSFFFSCLLIGFIVISVTVRYAILCIIVKSCDLSVWI